MTTALVVFSGGLDSILAVKVLQEQGIQVTGLSFDSYFFDSKEAEKTAKQLGIKLMTKDISEQQLETVKNPQHGHGTALNPCIDCHGLMFRVAGELAKIKDDDGKKFDIIATGEVLGQRPFSQNGEALKKVEKLAGVDILRPLSARLLPITSYEEQGLVDRDKLLDISGKSRKRQLELVKKYGIEYFPSPAGGCRLTENEFGIKVKKLLDNDGQSRKLEKVDFELLRIGRHFWIESNKDTGSKASKAGPLERNDSGVKGPAFNERIINIKHQNDEVLSPAFNEQVNKQNKTHIILGKNHEENQQLKKSARSGDILVELKDLMGPTALIFRGDKLADNELKKIEQETKKLVLDRAKNSEGLSINEVEWIIN